MKLLVVSDIHDEEIALERIKEKMAPENGFGHLLVCGDISHRVSFAEDFIDMFPDAFIVPGNWDSKNVNETIVKAKNFCHKKRIRLGSDGGDNLDGFNIVGFGHSNITPFHTYGEHSEEEIYSEMSKLDIDGNTLLLMHCPPKGYFDDVGDGRRAGSESIQRVIEEKKPFAAFFGHVHEHAGTLMLGSTMLVKVPAAKDMKACAVEFNSRKMIVDFVRL